MIRTQKKRLSILVTLIFLFTIIAPLGMAGAAEAADYSRVTAPYVSDDGDRALGKMKVEFNVNDVASADELFFNLPKDFKYFPDDVDRADVTVTRDAYGVYLGYNNTTYVEITAPANQNAISIDSLNAVKVSDTEFKVTYNGAVANTNETTAFFYVEFKKVYVPSYEGDINVSVTAPPFSAFTSGDVLIGRTSSGQVTVSAVSTDTGNDLFNVTLRINESVTGSLKDQKDSLKFILPSGFEWVGFEGVTPIWGDTATSSIVAADFDIDEEELVFDPTRNASTSFDESSDLAARFELELQFQVADETLVKDGDIEMRVRGKSTVSPSTLVVGKYGDFGVTITADETPTVYSGFVEQEIGNIIIEETIGDSLVNGRNITLTLPSYAKWTSVPDGASINNGASLDFAGVVGSEGNVIRYRISSNTNTSASKLELEDFEIAIDGGVEGDLVVEVSGTAGIKGEVVVAKVVRPIVVTADSKADVKIGVQGQKLGDITITELEAGSIKDKNLTGDRASLVIKTPVGVEFAKIPTITVEDGDIRLDESQIRRAKTVGQQQPTDWYQFIIVPIRSDSNDASTIKVSDIYVNVDRTVAEGDLRLAVLGSAVLESNTAYANDDMDIDGNNETDYKVGVNGMFPQTVAVAAVAAGSVVTPAPGEAAMNAQFVIGSTTYTVNGVEQEMDVAPYVKEGRTYLPVRYVANALGVDNNNIMWDSATGTVTMIKGDKVVQVVVGSKNMVINGATIAMDAAPEITDGRTMLPFRWIAWAFGANVEWDGATQTVTMEL